MGYKRRTKAVLIAEDMLEAVKIGKYDLDGRLPSVHALTKRLGVSDKTVRNAYNMLERAGLAKWQTADPMGYPDGWNALAYCNNAATSAVDLRGYGVRHGYHSKLPQWRKFMRYCSA